MARATICIDVNDPAEVGACLQWLSDNRECLSFVSENSGCGCCVDMFDLEGPAEVLATIPAQIGSMTEDEDKPNGAPIASE